MDVSRGVEQEKPGASKRVVSSSRDFENPDMVVPGFELSEKLDEFDGNALVVLVVGWGGCGGLNVGLRGFG